MRVGLLTAVATAIAIGAIAVGGGGGGAANRFVATTGTNTGTCSSLVTACLTFDYAYHQASPGDIISVAAGTYVFQALTNDATKTANPVTIQPASGATVTVAGGQFGNASGSSAAAYVTLKGVNISAAWTFGTASSHDTVDGVTANATFIDVEGGDNDTVKNSTVSNCVSGPTPSFDDACAMRLIGTNQTVDNVVFHDLYQSDNVAPGTDVWHMEGIFVRGCTTCTIKNSAFYNISSTGNILVQDCCSLGPSSNITIVNNWFGPRLLETNPGAGAFTSVLCFTCEPNHNAIEIDGSGTEAGNGIPGLVIAFNSAYNYCDTSISTTYLTTGGRCGGFINCNNANSACGTSTSSALIYGNLLGMPSTAGGGNPASCFGRVTYSYNVFYPHNSVNGENGPCPGTGNVLRTSGLFPYTAQPVGSAQSSAGPDYTITGAVWTGDEMVPAALCANFPTDKNGVSRNDGNGCDAGATER